MEKTWPDHYIDLSPEQKEEIINEICLQLQIAIDDPDYAVPSEIIVRPTLRVDLDDYGNDFENDCTAFAYRFIKHQLTVNRDAVREFVEKDLFRYPDFYQWAKSADKADGKRRSEEELMRLAHMYYEMNRFDMERYLQDHDPETGLPLSDTYFRKDFNDWLTAMNDFDDADEDQDNNVYDPTALHTIQELDEEHLKQPEKLSYYGDTVRTSLKRVANVFWELTYKSSSDGKSLYIWEGMLTNYKESHPFTLYDYKNDGPIFYDKPIEWHIEAATPEISSRIKAELEKHFEGFYDDLPF